VIPASARHSTTSQTTNNTIISPSRKPYVSLTPPPTPRTRARRNHHPPRGRNSICPLTKITECSDLPPWIRIRACKCAVYHLSCITKRLVVPAVITDLWRVCKYRRYPEKQMLPSVLRRLKTSSAGPARWDTSVLLRLMYPSTARRRFGDASLLDDKTGWIHRYPLQVQAPLPRRRRLSLSSTTCPTGFRFRGCVNVLDIVDSDNWVRRDGSFQLGIACWVCSVPLSCVYMCRGHANLPAQEHALSALRVVPPRSMRSPRP
jgi:hypothetical protein